MEGTPGPVSSELAAVLRRAVLEHVHAERRRSFAPLLHVGVPGGAAEVFAVVPGERLDHGLRTDVVAALLRRGRRSGGLPLVWLTRPGPLELEDVDAQWLAAARSAAAESGTELTMVVVTRNGWFDPRSGATRTWKRLRRR